MEEEYKLYEPKTVEPKKAESKKIKSQIAKELHPYAWFRKGIAYFCRIRMVAHTSDTRCVNKKNGCGNCAVLLAYETILPGKDWVKIRNLHPGNLPKD